MKTAEQQTLTMTLLRLAELENEVFALRLANARIPILEAENAALKEKIARLEKDSSNSSLPPSSDIHPPKPPPPKDPNGRKIGGQKGHKKHTRAPFPPDQVDATKDHILPPEEVTRRGLHFSRWETHQQVELKVKPFEVTEHRRAVYFDPAAGREVISEFSDPLNAGLFGPRMKALTGSLNILCHASIANIKRIFGDAFDLHVSTGYICKALVQTSKAVAPAWQELKEIAPSVERCWMDETGHKENGSGKSLWCWALVTDPFTFFAIRASRAGKIVNEILGEAFKGLLHCDYFSAYVKIGKDGSWQIQHCIAHLLRDIAWLADHPVEAVMKWGKTLLAHLITVLKFHKDGVRQGAEEMRDILLRYAKDPLVPKHADAETMAKRLNKDWRRYFRFLWDPLAEPTNNRAERAIRPTVLHRKCTQGTRGDNGRRWWERAWTVVMTCRQQNRSSFQFFVDALTARAHRQKRPSLLPVAAV
jgi:transposase